MVQIYWAQSGSQHGKPLKTTFYNRNFHNRQSCCSNCNKYQHKFPVTFKMAKNEFKMLKTQVQKSQGECSSFSALPYCNPNTKEVLKDICFWATSYERDRKKPQPNMKLIQLNVFVLITECADKIQFKKWLKVICSFLYPLFSYLPQKSMRNPLLEGTWQ